MYNFFKSVLKVAQDKHREALKGKSGCKKKLHNELMQIEQRLQRSYRNNELSDDEYMELATAFNKINFNNLSEQRKGKLNL